jgi:DNA-binding transcriptional MerR regulator/uncharacterized protein (DUF433 family)
MAYPAELTSILTGVTPSQLRKWRNDGLLVPEVRADRPPLYSFRDLIALRTMAYLRRRTSLQAIKKAFANLSVYDMTDHPSEYRFAVATTGRAKRTIIVEQPDGRALDLDALPGQYSIFSFADVVAEFRNLNNEVVVPLYRPAAHLQLEPARRDGWPTIVGTRIDYDIVAQLVDGEEITAGDVQDYYPGVSAAAAESAVEFDERVRAVKAA